MINIINEANNSNVILIPTENAKLTNWMKDHIFNKLRGKIFSKGPSFPIPDGCDFSINENNVIMTGTVCDNGKISITIPLEDIGDAYKIVVGGLTNEDLDYLKSVGWIVK